MWLGIATVGPRNSQWFCRRWLERYSPKLTMCLEGINKVIILGHLSWTHMRCATCQIGLEELWTNLNSGNISWKVHEVAWEPWWNWLCTSMKSSYQRSLITISDLNVNMIGGDPLDHLVSISIFSFIMNKLTMCSVFSRKWACWKK